MTCYAQKSNKQQKGYESNTRIGAKNDTYSLFFLYSLPHLSRSHEISFIRNYTQQAFRKK